MPTNYETDGDFVVVTQTDVLQVMAAEVKACNIDKGWYDADRTFGDDIALLHSEVSEMLEAFRVSGNPRADLTAKNDGDPPVPAHEWDDYPPKPEGVGAEAADVLVRLLDTCERYDIDLFAEWRRKVTYNWTRPSRHGGKAL